MACRAATPTARKRAVRSTVRHRQQFVRNPVQVPPQSDSSLGQIAGFNGCLYSGPTQITLGTNGSGVGQITVISPDTPQSTTQVNGHTLDTNNTYVINGNGSVSGNTNNCPSNGTAFLPSNGVVFVENATAGETVLGANPFDAYMANSVTNLTSNPTAPAQNAPVTLTATVTSSSNQLNNAATVAFSQTTSTTTSDTPRLDRGHPTCTAVTCPHRCPWETISSPPPSAR